MSQKKTLLSFFKPDSVKTPGSSSRTPGSGSLNRKLPGQFASDYTPSPLQSASSRLNQMPSSKSQRVQKTIDKKSEEKCQGQDAGLKGSGRKLQRSTGENGSLKRTADESLDDEPLLKQPRLGNNEHSENRRERMLQCLGDGTLQESNLKAVQERFQWLTEGHKTDGEGRRPSDKDYDYTTVRVPPATWSKLSASQKQYWEVKKKYQDIILFFRVGSFYELYEDDAQVGHDVLGWKLTLTGVGACRQVGCSLNGIEEAVARLTAAGYKVGRMEQLETAAEAKAKRGPKATITRQLTRVHSPATATGAVGADAVTLLALYESPESHQDEMTSMSQTMSAQFGFAFLDAAAGRYYVGFITDDAGRTNLSAMLTQVSPREVVVGRNMLSSTTSRHLAAPPVPLTLSPTNPADYAEEDIPQLLKSGDNLSTQAIFRGLQIGKDIMKMDPAALIALSALVQHLKRLRADAQLVTSAQMVVPFELYEAALRLDGPTLQNLNILDCSGKNEGSLLAYLDTCASAGGRRLLRQWLCRPLQDIDSINKRLDAVDELIQKSAMASEFRSHLLAVRDLERLLGQVRNAASPPEDGLPNWVRKAAQQKRLNALNAALAGLENAIAALNCLRKPQADEPSNSALLQKLIAAIPEANVLQLLDLISSRLDVTEIKPSKKVTVSRQEVKLSQTFLDDARNGMDSEMAEEEEEDNDVSFRLETEVTTQLIAEFISQTPCWENIEASLSAVDVLCSFAAFSETSDGPTCRPKFVQMKEADNSQDLVFLDSEMSQQQDESSQGAVTDLKGLWHPCAVAGSSSSFVPNDLQLGAGQNSARSLLLTGPNMGGKSTLLRATCTATIMAQMGCHVAAESATMTPADRIFTRLGAQDRIVAGESTFLVECNEASTILRHASPASLVVLDELGRGTSTFDGYAIAYAVLQFLSQQIDCRLMFATHYHSLTVEFASSPKIKLGHMTAKVPTTAQADSGMPCITFLYKLNDGACPQSYGLQVAQLAGIPEKAIQRAAKAGGMLEEKLKMPREVTEVESEAGQAMAFSKMLESLRTVISAY